MKTSWRILLFPLIPLYGLGVLLRNLCFDLGILKAHRFKVPVISIGNLSTGGTGKSPHILLLTDWLSPGNKVAVVSRGYGRNTKGFLYVNEHSTAKEVGDEPLQLKKNHPEIIVAVDEKRAHGISRVIQDHPDTDVVLLDDAYQHRHVKPGLNILLIDAQHFSKINLLLPAGDLREPFSARKRADIIIITRASPPLDPALVRAVKNRIGPQATLYFSSVAYEQPKAVFQSTTVPSLKAQNILLVTGIARPDELLRHLLRHDNRITHLSFPDHHQFSPGDLQKIRTEFLTLDDKNAFILTTEKDAMRISTPDAADILADIPMFYLPISIQVTSESSTTLKNIIDAYIRKN
ncbi:MAG: tetraacyldisaccharide 4'-kinase [Flavobacteriales bacterium]|nr:tetraacyldisaccharide 4'-kinase [Flavobacteriales bacterium]